MIKEAELNWSSDGTPESQAYGDIYFSRENGLEESRYVFLQGNDLPRAWLNRRQFCIAEMGFGTGLNFLNTAKLWSESKSSGILHYVAFEKHPLSADSISKAIANWPELSELSKKLTDNLPDAIAGYHRIVFKELQIFLTLCYGDANQLLAQLNAGVDAWYLDGFAPAKNPELWHENLFKIISAKSNPGASAATFSAARVVKDGLALAGFDVSLRKGFGRKRDMLVAKRAGAKAESSISNSVAIVGAGLSGCLSALALSYRGIKSEIFECEDNAALGASGAAAGVIMPYISLGDVLRNEFFLNSFGFAWRQVLAESFYSRCAVLRLAIGQTQEKVYSNFDKLALPKNFAQILDPQAMTEKLGLKIDKQGFFFPSAGWISPKEYCYYAIRESACRFKTNIKVKRFERSADSLLLYDQENKLLGEFSQIIFANAIAAKEFFPDLPIKFNRGQIVYAKTTQALSKLKHVFCHEGYIMPADRGMHLIGASYDHKSVSIEQDQQQSFDLLTKLYRNLPEVADLKLDGYRVGFRTTTANRMPIVTEVEPGVYLNLAHGSRGLVSCGISGELIAGMINQEPLAVSQQVLGLLRNIVAT